MAAGITDAVLPKGSCAVRIMLFVGGPTTEGAGQVVDKELEQSIRSHKASIAHTTDIPPIMLFVGGPSLDRRFLLGGRWPGGGEGAGESIRFTIFEQRACYYCI